MSLISFCHFLFDLFSYKWTSPMFYFNFLNRSWLSRTRKKGFIETKQFLIYIVRQNVFIPRDLVKVAQKAPRIVVLIAPSDNVSSRWLGHPLHLNLAKILKLPRLHTSFHPLNSSLESNALLFSTIIRSSVPRLLLISENCFHGLLNARSHERLSQLQRC